MFEHRQQIFFSFFCRVCLIKRQPVAGKTIECETSKHQHWLNFNHRYDYLRTYNKKQKKKTQKKESNLSSFYIQTAVTFHHWETHFNSQNSFS